MEKVSKEFLESKIDLSLPPFSGEGNMYVDTSRKELYEFDNTKLSDKETVTQLLTYLREKNAEIKDLAKQIGRLEAENELIKAESESLKAEIRTAKKAPSWMPRMPSLPLQTNKSHVRSPQILKHMIIPSHT